MADLKISQLTNATTPLAGTEVAPLVQSSTTKKVTVANLTAGRAVDVLSLTATKAGNDAFARVQNSGAGAAGAWYFADSVDNNYMGVVLSSATVEKWFAGSYGTAAFQIKNGGRSGTEALRVETTNDVKVSAGNLVIGTSGKGIDFSATAGTGTSELFSDYEEGTWTPVDESGAGLTLTVTSATYTKIGRMVYASFNITYPSTANGSTQILGGLPFMATAVGSLSIAYTTQGASILGQVVSGNTQFFLYDAAGTNLANSQMSAKILRAVAIYQA